MVKNSKQSWQVGQTVKVGFLALTVIASLAPCGDGLPGAYILTNSKQLFSFVPHNGLSKISDFEAVEMCEESKRITEAAAARAAAAASRVINNAAVCAKLRQIAGNAAEFVGMSDVGGEQFAHYRNVAL
ncbi:hypothetical protein [Paraburkholderia nemoris]|uniref:hypothetical protein n=1 Tax=Paraburkholderia nemoris TaxID=2793076 RepID=UPI001B1A4ACD|nr:hypothetical protein [Paraburkholderia nemoris]CAE6839079.1 hypothetical protein R75777_06980 [Paraburkholderia nemoris]